MSASTWTDRTFESEEKKELCLSFRYGGQTALNVAQIAGNTELAEFLIRKGANPDIQPLCKDMVKEFIT